MAARLSQVPERITAGTSVELTLTYSDFPAGGGWSLTLHFHGKNDVLIDGADVVPAGNAFNVTIPVAKTQALGAGAPREGLVHDWAVRVVNGSDVKIADSGVTTIEPDPLTASSGSLQSFAEKMIALIRSALAGQTTADLFIQSYQIANRGVTRFDREKLLEELAYWESIASAEQFPGEWGPRVLPVFQKASL